MGDLLRFTIIGIVSGAVYAVAASGLVVTYTTSGVFNFAHGASGMVLAFTYWELSVNRGVPAPLALVLTLGIIAPLLGVLLDVGLFRRMANAPPAVTLVVTIAILVLFLGGANIIWSAGVGRTLPEFFPGHTIRLAGVVITFHQLTTIVVGVAVAGGLRVLLFTTRLGVTMRAVVDNRDLAAQNGVQPERVSATAWAIGTVLAGVAGILLAPELTLSQVGLTLLVINGYAAAILGQLRNLPLTFAGAMLLGIGQSYTIGYGSRLAFGEGWLGAGNVFQELYPVLPVVLLFAVLLFLPGARLRVGRVAGARAPTVPGLLPSVRNAGIFVAGAAVLSFVLGDVQLFDASTALAMGMVMLSLVLLSGYGGQVSLCQFAFVGIGALVMGKGFAGGDLTGVLAAGVVTAAVGVLVALPALRLQDLYLALVTFSVALFADSIVFDHPRTYDNGGSIFFDHVGIGPIDLSSDRAKFLVSAVGFAAFAVLVLAVRRGPFGRRLAALSDSPQAAATLGMDLVRTKIAVFALSAGMAGSAGAVFAVSRGSAGAVDFNAIQSLYVFLLVTLGGLTSISGAFIGGIVPVVLSAIQKRWFPGVEIQGLFIPIGAIVVSRSPNGFAGLAFDGWRRFRLSAGSGDRPSRPRTHDEGSRTPSASPAPG